MKEIQHDKMPILDIPSNVKRTFSKTHWKNNGIFLFQNRTFLTSVALLNVIGGLSGNWRTVAELYVFAHKFAKLQNILFSKCVFNKIKMKMRTILNMVGYKMTLTAYSVMEEIL